MWFFLSILGFKKLNFAQNKNMSPIVKKLIGLFLFSSLLILFGALAKIQHWNSLKPLMLAGLLLQTIVMVWALIIFLKNKTKST